MKPREERRTVLVGARMRVGARWGDVRILNISSRGLLIQSVDAPPRGSYLEVRRGMYTIVGRVMWTDDHRFGVQTQDPLSIEAIIREPDRSGREPGEKDPPLDRRGPQRGRTATEQRLERSKVIGRTAEFACVALVGAAAALTGYAALEQALAKPIGQVTAALAPVGG